MRINKRWLASSSTLPPKPSASSSLICCNLGLLEAQVYVMLGSAPSGPPGGQHAPPHGLTPAQLHAQKRAQQFQAHLAGHDPSAFKVPVKQSLTHFTSLSKDDPPPKPLTADEANLVKGWINKDVQIEQRLQQDVKTAQGRLISLAQSQAHDIPQDWIGTFDDLPPQVAQQPQRLIFTDDHIKARALGKRGRLRANLGWELPPNQPQRQSGRTSSAQHFQAYHTPEWETRRQELQRIAQEPEILIPIRIDAEHEGVKIRDVFTWNLKGISSSSKLYVH